MYTRTLVHLFQRCPDGVDLQLFQKREFGKKKRSDDGVLLKREKVKRVRSPKSLTRHGIGRSQLHLLPVGPHLTVDLATECHAAASKLRVAARLVLLAEWACAFLHEA